MVMKVLKEINAKVKFPDRQNKYLPTRLKRLLCNSLIQPHSDYGCTSWLSLFHKHLKQKLQVV